MKGKFSLPSADKIAVFLKQYKFILILILMGLVLLMLSNERESDRTSHRISVRAWKRIFP